MNNQLIFGHGRDMSSFTCDFINLAEHGITNLIAGLAVGNDFYFSSDTIKLLKFCNGRLVDQVSRSIELTLDKLLHVDNLLLGYNLEGQILHLIDLER
jgi:hypothetical protein